MSREKCLRGLFLFFSFAREKSSAACHKNQKFYYENSKTSRKVSLKEKKASLSLIPHKHTHTQTQNGKDREREEEERDAAAAQTESIYRERVKRGHVAVIQRARVPEK